MHKYCLLAIDPGKTGGIAWSICNGATERIYARKMPDGELDIFDALAAIERDALKQAGGNISAVIERVNFRPKQRGGWEFSGNYHGLRMALIALGITFRNPTPGQWQTSFGLIQKLPKKKADMTKEELDFHYKEKKRRSKELALEMYPGLKVTHMTSEALLLLAYLRKQTKFLTR